MGVIRDENETGKPDAVRINSGLPVDHSGPGLEVGPGIRSTSGRTPEACPPTAIGEAFQHKSGPEVQEPGRFLGTAEGSPRLRGEAEQPSSLDYLQTNRNKRSHSEDNLKRLGRKRYCGRVTIAGAAKDGRVVFHRVACKTWSCSYCGPKKAKRYKGTIRAIAEHRRLNRFLTLTLDPSKIEGDPVRYLRGVFNKFRTYLKRKYHVSISFIAVLEFQKSGNPHLHVLVDRFIEQQWLSTTWEALGGGRIVDIRFVDVHRISHYLSKYLTKQLLLSAPGIYRRVTTSRDIHLNERIQSEISWALLKIPIFSLFERLYLLVAEFSADEDGLLTSFSIFSKGE